MTLRLGPQVLLLARKTEVARYVEISLHGATYADPVGVVMHVHAVELKKLAQGLLDLAEGRVDQAGGEGVSLQIAVDALERLAALAAMERKVRDVAVHPDPPVSPPPSEKR